MRPQRSHASCQPGESNPRRIRSSHVDAPMKVAHASLNALAGELEKERALFDPSAGAARSIGATKWL
eukprot:4932457-Amphidinium_carterae.1